MGEAEHFLCERSIVICLTVGHTSHIMLVFLAGFFPVDDPFSK